MRKTDMDGPIRCSSLTLEREEHLPKLHDFVVVTIPNTGAVFSPLFQEFIFIHN
jgi:hypothetical protein